MRDYSSKMFYGYVSTTRDWGNPNLTLETQNRLYGGEGKTIENMLASFVSQNQKHWDGYLPLLVLQYRSTQQETTGASPCEMMLGMHVSLLADLVLEMSEYAYKLSQNMDKCTSLLGIKWK